MTDKVLTPMVKTSLLLMWIIWLSGADKLLAQQRLAATPYAERLVIGTVIAINADRCLITIRQSNLFGRLRLGVESYTVTQGAILAGYRPGDRVKGVLSSADGKLHRLRHIENRPFGEREVTP